MKYIIPNNRIHPELEYFDEAYHRYCSGAKFPQGCKDLRDEKIKLTLELTNAYSEKNIDINKEYERFCYKENSSIVFLSIDNLSATSWG